MSDHQAIPNGARRAVQYIIPGSVYNFSRPGSICTAQHAHSKHLQSLGNTRTAHLAWPFRTANSPDMQPMLLGSPH